MPGPSQDLLDDLAKALGVGKLPLDENGGVQLTIGDSSTAILFVENAGTLFIVSPVAELPKQLDYGTALWLLRRNFYDSPIAPFQVSCDTAGNVVLWGRLPVEDLNGTQLASLLQALGEEAALIRDEIAVDESPEPDEEEDEEQTAA
jgi:hypothetical protein